MAGDAFPFHVTFDLEGERRHATLETSPVSVGRSHTSDLELASESISRRHAEFVFEDEAWWVVDLGSKNGVLVNDTRVERQAIEDGDRVRLGNVVLYCRIPQPVAELVFDETSFVGSMTGFIDMGQFNSMLSGDAGPTPAATPVPASAVSAMDDSLERSAWVLRLFNEAAEALLTSHDLDQMLEKVVDLAFDHLPADRGFVCLYEGSSDTITPKARRSRVPGQEPEFAISRTIANAAIRDKRSVLVEDTGADSVVAQAHSIVTQRITSVMCAPLYSDERVGGFIYVDTQSEDQPFDKNHLQVLSTLAVLSAVAVEQTALRDNVAREQKIRERLARYSSPNVVNRLIEVTAEGGADMLADEAEITVLFADLSGFTSMSERMSPPQVTDVLNAVFARLTRAVFELDGTLDKFIGDEIMAFFGAPIAQEDHAARAVRAALRMHTYLAEYNAARPEEEPMRMSIGLNSGPAVVGDIGSPQRKDYTVIGDTVNTAKRLESAAEPGQIVIGPATNEQIGEAFETRALDELMLKGKERPVRPFVVVGER